LHGHDDERKRHKRAVRAAIVLGLVAIALYVGFIVLSVLRGNS
jgi:hypothetical protein